MLGHCPLRAFSAVRFSKWVALSGFATAEFEFVGCGPVPFVRTNLLCHLHTGETQWHPLAHESNYLLARQDYRISCAVFLKQKMHWERQEFHVKDIVEIGR